MSAKLTHVFMVYCLFYFFTEIQGSFIKANNVPRVGRSNEAGGPFDQGTMGYVIKTNKNIPRMGRRNFDSENHFDIPKFYQLPVENIEAYGENGQGYNKEQLEPYYEKQFENMMSK